MDTATSYGVEWRFMRITMSEEFRGTPPHVIRRWPWRDYVAALAALDALDALRPDPA